MINEEKFEEINKLIFDTVDTDNSGTLEREEIESFVKSLLHGIAFNDEEDYEQQTRSKMVFNNLDEN